MTVNKVNEEIQPKTIKKIKAFMMMWLDQCYNMMRKFAHQIQGFWNQSHQRLQQGNGADDYFTLASGWADDIYTAVLASRNRYKVAFYWVSGIATVLALCILMMLPLTHTELVLVHQSNDGTVWIEPTHQTRAPSKSQSLIESELVRYVINRESYDATSYPVQFSLVNLMSTDAVARNYMRTESASNHLSSVRRLGNTGERTVHVDNVLFLDREEPKNVNNHHNLAQVDFTVTENLGEHQQVIPLVAVISWAHRGTPQNPNDKWRNWDGFTVTRYTVEQRNV